MSLNLTLTGFELYQTPTAVTKDAMASDPKKVYFAWLDTLVEQSKPKMHPRASNAQKKAIMSTPEWKEYQDHLGLIARHKAAVERHLEEHPEAEWGWV